MAYGTIIKLCKKNDAQTSQFFNHYLFYDFTGSGNYNTHFLFFIACFHNL